MSDESNSTSNSDFAIETNSDLVFPLKEDFVTLLDFLLKISQSLVKVLGWRL